MKSDNTWVIFAVLLLAIFGVSVFVGNSDSYASYLQEVTISNLINISGLSEDTFPLSSGNDSLIDSYLYRDYLEAGGLVFTNTLIYNHSFFSNNNQDLLLLKAKDGSDLFKVATTGGGTSKINFNDQESSYVGSDPSFTNYFSFGNNINNMWLGIASDPFLYFNYLIGSGEVHGTTANYQNVDYFISQWDFTGSVGSRYIIDEPVIAKSPWRMRFAGPNGVGIRIESNKIMAWGDPYNGDLTISHDGTKGIINPIANDTNSYLQITGDTVIDRSLNVTENVTIGDSTNNMKIYDNGKVSFSGTAKNKQHIMIPLLSVGKGATKLTETSIGDYNVWEYQLNDEAIFDMEFPHNIDYTENISIHISYIVEENYSVNNGEVRWNMSYSLVSHDENEQIDNPTHQGYVDSGDLNIPAWSKTIAHQFFDIDASMIDNNDDILGVTLKRIGLVAGNNPSGTNYPLLVGFHLEYYSNKLGTYG